MGQPPSKQQGSGPKPKPAADDNKPEEKWGLKVVAERDHSRKTAPVVEQLERLYDVSVFSSCRASRADLNGTQFTPVGTSVIVVEPGSPPQKRGVPVF